MSEAIMVALITGGLTLVGTVITVVTTSKKTTFDMRVAQAVTDTKIQELSDRMNKHNQVLERTYKLESDVAVINEKLKGLEDDHK